jgi:hypothetical protein
MVNQRAFLAGPSKLTALLKRSSPEKNDLLAQQMPGQLWGIQYWHCLRSRRIVEIKKLFCPLIKQEVE